MDLRRRERDRYSYDRPRLPEEREKIAESLRAYYREHPEKHPRWRGGTFSQKRGPNWPEQSKAARERDQFTCQHCGMTEAELGKRMAVHHIKPFRQFESSEEANQLDNLVSLCPSCHWKADHALGVFRLSR